jgi:acyl-CoA synthetase (AMP-forming)/AMP-acid ligase II
LFAAAIAHAARAFADRPAMYASSGWHFTFRELDRLTDEAAVGLSRRGVRAGEVVALALPSTPDYLIAYGALAKLGAITAGVNPKLAPPERSALVNECAQAAHVITTEALGSPMQIDANVIEITVADHPDALLANVRERAAAPAALPPDPDRVVAIIFTSGTTALPKGAVFTEQRLYANATVDIGNGWGEGGPVTGNTQFCHVGFMAKVPAQFMAGTTYHVIEPWRSDVVLATLARYRMPAVGGVAPQIALLLRDPTFDEHDFTHTKLIVSGGAAASGALIREAKARFQADWTQRYALTETGGSGCFTWIDAPEEEMLFTVGRPRPGIELKVSDGEGRPLPEGEAGEVCIRSPANMLEYWRNPVATRQTVRDGWVHTNDEGMIDDRGCLRLLGRRGDSYSRGGYVIFPKEAEQVLSWHPKVAQVVVVPRPDAVMGAIGVAVVIARDRADPPSLRELREFGAQHLAKFKLPEALRVVDTLPMTAMLKIDKRALAREEEAATARTPQSSP